jgi:hypothetical protein
MDEQKFITGFNQGYLLAKHEPALTASLSESVKPSNDFLEGFVSGKLEYTLEQERVQLQELQNLRDQSKNLHRDLERD